MAEPAPARDGSLVMRSRRLTVAYGESILQPVQFNGFRFGGLSISFDVTDGEDAIALTEVAYEMLRGIAEQQYKQGLDDYVRRLKDADGYVRSKMAGT